MIPFLAIAKNEDELWSFTWDPTAATFYRVILNGHELGQVTDPVYVYALPGYEETPPPLEVAEEDDTVLSERELPYIMIQWYAVECSFYLLEEFVGSAWVRRSVIVENNSWVYTVQTPILDDGSKPQYRVRAVDELGDTSEEIDFGAFVCRPPPPPSVSVDFDDDTSSIVIDEE